ncbi:3-dehydroquinate synthase [Miniphocaeibacter massiliensis]|uniref:3-dehydroquinate synthase n=1 Tax=Miniphocaeibacter massiliensis TaxID=2041841 RepID=UPI000C1B9787|nr:3-dehydroquinate synthase [Miniphocaeibacter massiliensis]
MINIVKVPIKTSVDYDVIIGRNILDIIPKRITELKNKCSVVIITDDRVDSLYGKKVSESLTKNNIKNYKFVFKNGEKSKNINTLSHILEFLAENTINRNDLIVALGGGVVGDIAGFAAAIYLRGIDYLQIPTTFLAAIDSSVGGKTAIDLEAGKNLAGAFKQPIEVLCDVETFKTLEDNIFDDGVAEAIKYGVLFDEELFYRFLNGKVDSKSEDIIDIVKKCVEHKRDVVIGDEFDTGKRQLLNLGHTIGHAIEKCSDYKITHGHAIAAGMAIIARATELKKINDEKIVNKIEKALIKNNLPIDSSYSIDELFEKTTRDKKVLGSKINLIIPKKIGECELYNVNVDEVREFIELGKGE